MTSGASARVDELLAWPKDADADLFTVIERLYAEPDVERAAAAFVQLAKDAYVKRKNVPEMVAIARAGIQFCLCCSRDDASRAALRQKAKAMAFNLAANTWPGWGDEGIELTASDLAVGLDAARLNLRLARELGRGPLAESKAHWALGAHWLAGGQHASAIEEFTLAAHQARAAGNVDDEDMNLAYVALVAKLRGDAEGSAELERIVARLTDATRSNDARFYATQLSTVYEVFRGIRASDNGQ